MKYTVLTCIILQICCYEGTGSYVLTLNNATMKEGGDFGSLEKLRFKIHSCAINKDCEDNDPTTNDICNRNASVCIHTYKNCEEYGSTIEVNITTDSFPRDTRWSIRDNNGLVKFEGGPYKQARNHYHHKTCLPIGMYNFTILDTKGDGLYMEDEGGYKLSANNQVVEEYRGHLINGRFSTRTNIFITCMANEECEPYNLGYCRNGLCVCASDEQCEDDVSCTIDSCDNGTCNNICHPFGPSQIGEYVNANGSLKGLE